MSKITYSIGGELVTADELALRAKRAPKPIRSTKGAASSFHKGWVVEGHPPGAIEAAKVLAIRLCVEWAGMLDAEKAEAIKSGRRPPKAWNEAAYISETKKKRPVSRPYSIHESAEACAELARKAGWEHVQVVALRKGDDTQPMF